MKKGINQWSFPASYGVADCLRLASEAGFERPRTLPCETGELSLDSSIEDISRIARAAEQAGLEIRRLPLGFTGVLAHSFGPSVQRESAGDTKQLEFASLLGADTILYVPR